MFQKTFSADFKASDFSADGLPSAFTGYAAVFGNIDLGGDLIVKGAFAETLAKRYPGEGAGIPCYWNHNLDDPFANIGSTVKAVENDHGLFVEVSLDTETDWGQQVARLLKDGRVGQMSFSFDVIEGAFVESEDGYYYELRKLDLFEVSVVPIGMNQATEILSVKSAMEKDPHRRNSDAEIKNDDAPTTGRRETAARRLRVMTL